MDLIGARDLLGVFGVLTPGVVMAVAVVAVLVAVVTTVSTLGVMTLLGVLGESALFKLHFGTGVKVGEEFEAKLCLLGVLGVSI